MGWIRIASRKFKLGFENGHYGWAQILKDGIKYFGSFNEMSGKLLWALGSTSVPVGICLTLTPELYNAVANPILNAFKWLTKKWDHFIQWPSSELPL